MEEKLDLLLKEVAELKERQAQQDEKLDYIVKRLDHMRDKAHQARENEVKFPK